MSRLPWQVLVYPYRLSSDGRLEYALLRRSDVGWWQGVAGGGEGSEVPLEAARREAFEEIGAPDDSPFVELDTRVTFPVSMYRKDISQLWGDGVYVIPQYCFGVNMFDNGIVLSEEHTEYRWLSYKEAQAMVDFEGNTVALWELHARLTGQGGRGLGIDGLERILPNHSDG